MDTQWPRYEVFEQERPDQPHRNAGSVHAPDPELALQNARDVFERRPEGSSLWVVPANQIYAWTTEALLADPDWQSETILLARPASPYEVFHKQGQRQSETYVTHVGTVSARSPAEAMRLALAQFDTGSVYVWWVVPAYAILHSAPSDADGLFGPARDKTYRQPNEYRVHQQLRAASDTKNEAAARPPADSPTGAGTEEAAAKGEEP